MVVGGTHRSEPPNSHFEECAGKTCRSWYGCFQEGPQTRLQVHEVQFLNLFLVQYKRFLLLILPGQLLFPELLQRKLLILKGDTKIFVKIRIGRVSFSSITNISRLFCTRLHMKLKLNLSFLRTKQICEFRTFCQVQ